MPVSATSRHSRGLSATAAVDLSCEQTAAIIAHDRESNGRDLSLAIEGGYVLRWTLLIQMMTDAQVEAFRFNPFYLTKVWPWGDYRQIEVGMMELNRWPDKFLCPAVSLIGSGATGMSSGAMAATGSQREG
jgi:catalase